MTHSARNSLSAAWPGDNAGAAGCMNRFVQALGGRVLTLTLMFGVPGGGWRAVSLKQKPPTPLPPRPAVPCRAQGSDSHVCRRQAIQAGIVHTWRATPRG